MSKFIQLHLLTSYPPANLNRDDLGRPKTAMMGRTQRLRISSQSLKRAWRTSDVYRQSLEGHIGKRTKEMGEVVKARLEEKGIKTKDATGWARKIAGVFGKLKKEGTEIEQLAHISPEEEKLVLQLVDTIASESRAPREDELKLLRVKHTAADIAMFGRMLASNPKYNMDAAVQVGHAITVHEVAVEDDFFTAVDDLNVGDEDAGAGHMGETEFAAGLFYSYICIDRELLMKNLNKDVGLVTKSIEGLIKAAVTVSPTGKQNSFASRAYASYVLVEKGPQQPRNLSVAFLKSINSKDVLEGAITAIEQTRNCFENAYGQCADGHVILDVNKEKGSLEDVIRFVTG